MNKPNLQVDMDWFREQHAARVNLINNMLGWNGNAKYIKPNVLLRDDVVLISKGLEHLAQQLEQTLKVEKFNGEYNNTKKSFTLNGIEYFQLYSAEDANG